MVFCFQPIRKLMQFPFFCKHIILRAQKHLINLICMTCKIIGYAIESESEVYYMVPFMFYAVTRCIGFATKSKINRKHCRRFTNRILAILAAKDYIKAFFKRNGRANFAFFHKDRGTQFDKHMNTSPSSLMSTARSAYRQSITDKKSVASPRNGRTLWNNIVAETGPFTSSFSTSGISANVLSLYEYNLFGSCIEYLTTLDEVANDDSTEHFIL